MIFMYKFNVFFLTHYCRTIVCCMLGNSKLLSTQACTLLLQLFMFTFTHTFWVKELMLLGTHKYRTYNNCLFNIYTCKCKTNVIVKYSCPWRTCVT
ncbi:hypothetical protein FKM82_025340 [Ascaphus truei]